MNPATVHPANPAAAVQPFVWSFARHETFQTCLRRYWYAYYGAWGGWRTEAAPAVRELYRLKRLFTRQQWTGRHIHQALDRLVAHHLADPAPPAELAARAAARELDFMREEFRDSRTGTVQPPRAAMSGLFEHEYNLDVPVAEWKAAADRVSAATAAFCASPLWETLRGLPEGAVLAIDRKDAFELDGLPVRSIPDLAYRDGGILHLCDWKSGQTPLADSRLELGIHVLSVLGRWAGDPAAVRAAACNPATGETAGFAFTASDLDDLREFVRDSADEMLFPLEDPERNLAPSPDAFDCTADSAPCADCPFLRHCPRWRR
jgi:hypothetical protein